MGQRSQIYVRYNGKLILARYYQWNYGERMISRARYGIEYIKYYVDNGFDFVFRNQNEIEKMSRVFDVNFDMKDVQISNDILKEWEEYGEGISFFDYVFTGQDNNDGQLFVDIEMNDENATIKYAFFDCEIDYDTIMSASEYMDWDNGDRDWQVPVPYMNADTIKTCRENIEAINETAQLMTREEVNSFIKTEDYFGQPVPF